MVRPEIRILLASERLVRVSAGARGRGPQPKAEMPPARAGRQKSKPWRVALILLVGCFVASVCAASDDQNPTAVVQHLFDAMAAHDANGARALFIPEAILLSVRPDGAAVAIPYEKWLGRFGTSKDTWLERVWNAKVLEHGSVAVVWADYDFHLNGKFSHCGIDSFSLLKTAGGWKIAAIADTHERTGCAARPDGTGK